VYDDNPKAKLKALINLTSALMSNPEENKHFEIE
jgi:hypothetical protein